MNYQELLLNKIDARKAKIAVAAALYRRIVEQVVPVSSTAAAEMVKLLENTFRAVNIALVNEFLVMCDKLGLDAWEIIEAAATRPGAIIRSPHSRQTPFGDGCGVGAGFPS